MITTRRFITALALAGALLAGGLTMPQARAVKGSCDHTLDPLGYNAITFTKGNGDVTIDTRWTWDGVSIYPACDGPIIRIRVTNTGQTTWYAHVTRRRGGTRTVVIEPGAARNYTGTQLANAGIETLGDLGDLALTTNPIPPAGV